MSEVVFIKKVASIFLLTFMLVWGGLFWVTDVGGAETAKIPFRADDDLELIRAKIAANGYDFKVSSNWVVRLKPVLRDRMRSRSRPEGAVGVMRESASSNDLGPLRNFLGRSLPLHFDLRNVSPGRSYIGPVRNQGSCGACYAFGACAAAEGAYNLATGSYDEKCVDFSEAFIAFCLDPFYAGFDGCAGSDYDYAELDSLLKEGVCYEKQMPYNSLDTACSYGLKLPTVRFTSWHRLPCNDPVMIKAAIRYFGVVDVSVATSSAFDAYASGIYEDSKVDCKTSYSDLCYYVTTDHVVALVGWDDNGGDGYWILRNSWGQDWGEAGYMRIKYSSARVACAACYVVFTPEQPPLAIVHRSGGVYPALRLLLED
ncbi:hypothetical protein KAI46_04090 [bacterium]|nr:hypothetical protein [bacterium]